MHFLRNMSDRLREILKKNAEFEEKAPYNFCDRWCERCVHEKQIRCKLYLDEFERKITRVAHGRDEDDLEMTKAVMDEQFKGLDEKLSEDTDRFGIDFDDFDIVEESDIDFVENNSLNAAAKSYYEKAHVFLEKVFYSDNAIGSKFKYDFETVSWYHVLLPVKLYRALSGFYEPAVEVDISLCDAVAQFEICKKAIKESIEALRRVKNDFIVYRVQIVELIALLHNIYNRVEDLLSSI